MEEVNSNKAVILLTGNKLDLEHGMAELKHRTSNLKLKANKCIDVLVAISGR